MGTSNYIAPEQASGLEVGPYTDVYSLGVVLFELLTGELPFTGDSFVAVAMRHVHEPPPSVLGLRPEVPLRVVSAVDRALAKEPENRFGSMGELVAELEAALAELGSSPAEDATAIVPPRVVRESAPHATRPRRRRRAGPVVALLAGLAVLAAIVALAVALLRDDDSNGGGGGANPPAAAAAIKLVGVAAYDPEGDGQEHDDEVRNATDGDPATYWTTETYRAFSQTKEGVGVVLDAGGPVAPTQIRVATDTPGYTAEIRAGASPSGPFQRVSPSKQVSGTALFSVDTQPKQYYVVWITDLDGRAHVNEVTARG
jgi:hypothetical protein